jgi:major membrane immunogen (membrane-anchored lipoprotein)
MTMNARLKLLCCDKMKPLKLAVFLAGTLLLGGCGDADKLWENGNYQFS